MLNSFINEIKKNSSEFRFLPDNNDVLDYSDYSEIYNILREDNASLNKLRDVRKIEINKFNFSKFLGKMSSVNSLVKDQKEVKFAEDLLEIFDNSEIISNYMFWERIIQILILDNNLELTKLFIAKIINACNSIEEKNNDLKTKLQITLYRHLSSSLNRVLALVWGKEIKQLIKSIENQHREDHLFVKQINYNSVLKMRKAYCYTRMINKYVIPIMVHGFLNEEKLYTDEIDINFSDFFQCYNLRKNIDFKVKDYIYTPYMVNLHDLQLLYWFTRGDFTEVCKLYTLKNAYAKLNYNVSSNNTNYFKNLNNTTIEIENESYNVLKVDMFDKRKKVNGKFKIAIANAKVNDNYFLKAIQNKTCCSYEEIYIVIVYKLIHLITEIVEF